MIELEGNEKLRSRIKEDSRIFGYSVEPKFWKSWTPLDRMRGFEAGTISELKRTLLAIDLILQDGECKELQRLRRIILDLDPDSNS